MSEGENINKGNPLEKTYCPFTPEQLRELYWKEEKSTVEIAAIVAEMTEQPIKSGKVAEWFKKCNIPIRSRADANKLKDKKRQTETINKGNPLETTYCPFTPEKLEELYWKEKKSTIQIAAIVREMTGRQTGEYAVRKWLKMCDISVRNYTECQKTRRKNEHPETINKGNSLETTYCPFTAERLRELYWKEGKSTIEIADMCTSLMDRKVRDVLIAYWMKLCDIPIRNPSQRAKLRLKKYPGLIEAARIRFKENFPLRHTPEQKEKARILCRKNAKKANQSSLKEDKDHHIVKKCDWYKCSNVIDVIMGKFRQGEGKFCSRSCARKHYWYLKRMAKFMPTPPQPEPIELPDWLQESAERMKALQGET